MRVNLNNLDQRLKALEANIKQSEGLRENLRNIDIKDQIAEVYYPIHEDVCQGEHSFFNLRGGRGSGKSSYISLELIYQIMNDETGLSNALVVRKWAVTLRGSVFSQLQWAIDILGVSEYWRSTLNPMQFIFKPTGAVIRLTGLDDPQKLKSIKPIKGYFKYLWCEEFSEISGEAEMRNLQQSVLRGGEVFCVFRSFNPPISNANWANQLCQRADDRAVNLITNYLQIPVEWLGQTFIDEADRLKEINLKAYQHEFLGMPVGQGAEVFSENLEIRKISEEEISQLSKIYQGLDWGFSTDPACFLRVSYEPKTETIWILDEIYKTHLSNSQLAEEITSRGWELTGRSEFLYLYGRNGYVDEKALVIADSSEPKSIADLNSLGVKTIACKKFAGCVEYRIRWLCHRKIICDPARTPNTARELQNYQYDVDKRTGEVLSSLPDRDNHSIDALAYSLDRVIYNKKYPA